MGDSITETKPSVGDLFSALNAVEVVVHRVVEAIPDMEDSELEECLVMSPAFESGSFIIRGAAINEIQTRIAKRLSGGRGHKDVEGIGVGAHIASLSHRLGKSHKTLETDARIFRRFGEQLLSEQDHLDREAYVICLGCGERAEDALELAHSKRDNPAYSLRHFKLDCHRLCSGEEGEDLIDLKWVTVALSTEEYRWLRGQSRQAGCKAGESLQHLVQKAMMP